MVNLKKISLTKNEPKISLTKKSDCDLIKINLNWNQNTNKENNTGFFAKLFGSKKTGIDLDLGAFVRLSNGNQFVIQALGESFGDFQRIPYVTLLGDDRTGENKEGEWIYINGKHLDKISEILIYTFIYEGVSNWRETDGVVQIFIPGEPIIETKLTDGDDRHTMCAIARIVIENGKISLERINRYFQGHSSMDEAFSWGFNWVEGRK